MPGYGPGMHAPGSASGRAIAALVCAIASWVACGCLTSIPAVFLAWSELKDIEAGAAPMEGKGLATAALWVGAINAVLYIIVLLIYLVVFVIFGISAAAGP
jgi:hypothetical protein